MSLIVQSSSVGKFTSSRTPAGVSLTGVTAGNSLIFVVGQLNYDDVVSALTVSDGTAYTQGVYTTYNPGGPVYAAHGVFYRHNVSGGNYTAAVTSAVGSSPFGQFKLYEVSGLLNAAPDKTAGQGTFSSAPSTGSTGTLTNSNNFAIGVYAGEQAGIDPANDSFVNSYLDNTTGELATSIDYKYTSGTSAINLNWGTLAASGHWAGAVAVFADAGTNTPLSVTEGYLTFSGQSVSTIATGDTILSLTETVATFTGQTFNFLYEATWTEGYLVLAGSDLTLIANGDTPLVVTTGTATFTGSDVPLGGSFTLDVVVVTGVFTGQTIGFLQDIFVQPVTEGYLYLLGQDVTILNSMSFPYTGSKISVVQVSTSGKTQWVDYIPVKYITVANAKDINTWNLAGGLAVKTISGAGLVAWKDYKPVAIVGYPTSGANRFDSTGYIQVVEVS